MNAIINLQSEMNAKFDAVNTRFDAVDEHLKSVDGKFAAIDAQLEGINAQFDAVNIQFDGINAQFEEIRLQMMSFDVRIDRLKAMSHEILNVAFSSRADVKVLREEVRSWAKDVRNLQRQTV